MHSLTFDEMKPNTRWKCFFDAADLTTENLEECFNSDVIFVQFFNSFLALPAFPRQLMYNITHGCFEEFQNTLADDINGEGSLKEAATLKQKFDYFKTTINEESTKLGYYVKVLEKEKGLQWVVENRLQLFLKSEKYADYKLVKKLAKAQVHFLCSLLNEHQLNGVSSNCKHTSVKNRTNNGSTVIHSGISTVKPSLHKGDDVEGETNGAAGSVDLSVYINSLRKKLMETKSVEEWKTMLQQQGNSFADIRCDNTPIYEILWCADKLQDGTQSFTLPDESMQAFLDETQRTFPVNLLYNEGLTAFKEFLCETTGEKNLLLWLELERCKGFDDVEQRRALSHIKERYLRAGSPFELSKERTKALAVNDVADVTIPSLQAKQEDILAPILRYWCHRFTMHQQKQKFNSFKDSRRILLPAPARTTEKQNYQDVPIRPLSCGSHLRMESSIRLPYNSNSQTEVHSFNDSDSGVFSEDGSDVGITRRKLRVKSAYPRLIASKLPRNTNAGPQQLQLASSFMNEGFGFKAPAPKYYHNDASDAEHKKSVRLYIQPVPSFNATASTLKSKSNFYKEDDLEESLEFQKDLDSLVDMLLHEHHTGNYFLLFLSQQQNKAWLDCYHFWHALQEYNEYFFVESFAPTLVKRKANMIYSTFIVNNSTMDIQCPAHMRVKIHKRLDPPYEDLYDDAEQHALTTLVQPWLSLIMRENQQFGKLQTEEHLKYIEVNRTYNWRYLIEEEEFCEFEEDDDKGNEDKISPEEVERPLPVTQDKLNFDLLIRNKAELEHFQNFLESRHKQGILDLTAWTDMEVFRRLPRGTSDKIKGMRDKKAMEIREKWLNKHYFFGSSTPATKSGLKKILENAGNPKILPKRPSSAVINETQKYSRARVERRWLILFQQTKEYLERRNQGNSVSEMVEDLLVKKKIQRSEHAWRLLNSRFNSNSRDVTGLRMALSHPEECDQFRQFIKVRGEMMEHNLNFWLEVQKYKDLCHSHVQDSIIRSKLRTIVDVFIKSHVPPELQIDIPIEIAERLCEKACGKSQQHGPYLFREAQTTVFRIMFNHWKEFLKFRAQASDQVTLSQSLLELQNQHRQEISRKKMMVEKRRLARLVVEKRKREHISKERGKVKQPQDLFSVMANTINVSEHEQEYDVSSFFYSKYRAEDELRSLELQMKELGIPLDDTETRKSTMSGFTLKQKSVLGSDHASNLASTVMPPLSTKTVSVRTAATNKGKPKRTKGTKAPVRRVSYFNTTGAMEMRKMSLGAAYDRGEELRDMKNMEKTLNDLDTKTRYTRFSHNPSAFRYDAKSGLTRLTAAKSGMIKSIRRKSSDKGVKMKTPDQVSCVSDLPKVHVKLEEDTKKKSKKAKTLTKKSLKAFERTPEGKPLKNPLHLEFVDSVPLNPGSSCNDKHIPEVTYTMAEKEEKKEHRKLKARSEIKVNPRLPHNAGTASIIARRLREYSREESPPPVLEAEVIVY